jgi:NitT/TauT family transport system permease protein
MAIAGIIGGICVMLLWYFVAITGIVSNKILPNPVDMLCSIPNLFINHNLIGNIGYTVSLNLLGYVIALAIAIPLGFIIGIYPIPRAMFQKPLEGLRFLALPATTGLFVASLGLGFNMKATFLAVGILIYILPAVAQRVMELQNPDNAKDNVYLQTAVTIGMGKYNEELKTAAPIIGDRVVIWANAVICGGIKVGDNSVIGANSTVIRDVPPNTVVAGCPARIIRKTTPLDYRQVDC